MRLPISIREGLLVICLSLFYVTGAGAFNDVSATFLFQDATIAAGEQSLLKAEGQTASAMLAMNVAQTPMRMEYKAMSKWARQYYAYLDTASYVANSVQATTTIYVQALEVLRELIDVGKAIKDSPQGLISSSLRSDLYIQTSIQLINVFRTLKYVVSKGGRNNLMNGRERCEVLWSISNDLDVVKRNLRSLTNEIRYCTMADLWWDATISYGIYDHRQIAERCLHDMCRASRTISDNVVNKR